MAASKQHESKEEDFNYKTKYKAYKRRLKLLVYVSATGVGLVTVLKYLNLIRCTFDFVQEQEYFKSLLEKIEQSLIVVERDKRCGVHVMLAALQLYIRTTQWLMQCTVL